MAVRVQSEDFDIETEIAALTNGKDGIGAVATFTGKVRGEVAGKPLLDMTLEHYPGMTEAEMARIEQEAQERFELSASLVVHRIGTLRPGDNIVLVVACAPHRHAALDACGFLMDFLKTKAPFWKKERIEGEPEGWVEARDADDRSASRWRQPKG